MITTAKYEDIAHIIKTIADAEILTRFRTLTTATSPKNAPATSSPPPTASPKNASPKLSKNFYPAR